MPSAKIVNVIAGVENVFVERLWRSLKCEEVYLKAYDTISEVRLGIGNLFPVLQF